MTFLQFHSENSLVYTVYNVNAYKYMPNFILNEIDEKSFF